MTRSRIPLFSIMFSIKCFAITLLACAPLVAADFSVYRGYQLGMTTAEAARVAGVSPLDAETIHQRPEVIQELKWRPDSTIRTDPVKDGLLHFFNGKLYRIVSNYDRYRVEGLTTEDMIASVSKSFGVASTPEVEVPYRSIYGDESAPVIGRWEDLDFQVNLVQIDHSSGFALIITDMSLEAQARAAIVESRRLDAKEAPLRALELRKQREREEESRLNEVRSKNLDDFRP